MRSLVLLTSLLAGPVVTFQDGGGSQDNCTGCLGSGGTSSSSGGTCDAMVSITVQVEQGICRWIQGEDELLFECLQTQGCKTTITRSWSGLPTGSEVDFCVFVAKDKLCLRPKTPARIRTANPARDRRWTAPTIRRAV